MGQTQETQTLFRNRCGQIECHGCGYYSDIIYPVHYSNGNGSWVSMVCCYCQRKGGPPGSRVVKTDDPIDKKTYGGIIKEG